VGFSFGLERLLDLLEEHGALPAAAGHAQALAIVLDAAVAGWAMDIVSGLRARGISVDLYPEISGAGKALKWADRKQVRWALFFGPDEQERQQVSWKDLSTGASGQGAPGDLASLFS